MSCAYDHAKAYTDAGISVVPVRCDGSKAPAVAWKHYQERIANDDELRSMFSNGCGIGIITGGVSGNLEVIDVESAAPIEDFLSLIERHNPKLLRDLVIIATPSGGRHLVVPMCRRRRR
jgi:putative DNA primase/helicase